MNKIIQSTCHTLQKLRELLLQLDDDVLSNISVPPYYSSIGSHIRHILDFYDCILSIESKDKIDLTARKRNKYVETCCEQAFDYLETIITKLYSIENRLNDGVTVIDDLGMGLIEMPYTYAALLAQANSHTIHHYAIINYILDQLGIVLKDSDFGYNPTTPKVANLN